MSADDDIPPLFSHIDSSEDEVNDNEDADDDDGWMELEQNDTTTICLFCSRKFQNSNDDCHLMAIEHMKNEHSFDLRAMKAKFCMDQYSFIKMVNYIRTHHIVDPKLFTSAVVSFWDDVVYMKPVEFESWLMYDFDTLEVPHNAALAIKSPDEIIKELCFQLMEKDALLERATQDIQRLQESFRKTFDSQMEPPIKRNNVGAISAHMDEGYFSTYAHYEIHYDMLSDKVRTDSYRDAIYKNSDIIKDKIVMDLGCGTSILSMFASKAGAKQVISVDQSDIIYHAMDIVRKNNVQNITFVKGRIEDTPLPIQDCVDIIISEWMGYFLLFEGMLDSVIYARDNHLKQNTGLLLPNRCTLSLIGFGNEERHRQYIEFWQNVYGFDMTCLQKEVLHEAVVETCNPDYILTSANVISEFDLMSVTVDCVNFSYDFTLNVIKSGRITSFVGYFDTIFDLPSSVSFSTSPNSMPTHWKQVIFYIKTPVNVTVGEQITGKILCRRDRKDLRALVIKIEVFGDTLQYNLN